MKKAYIVLIIILATLCTTILIFNLIPSNFQRDSSFFGSSKNGPSSDKIIFSVEENEKAAVDAILEGRKDVFLEPVSQVTIRALSEADREKLEFYTAPATSYSILLNPIPNSAPYTITKNNGETEFNPFAIKAIRYSINWLINRQEIVDSIFFGNASSMFTAMSPIAPGTFRYNEIAFLAEMTNQGNERKAISDIERAMIAASELPENIGRLQKPDKFWQFDGKNIEVKVLIRSDDSKRRLPIGRYIANQLEKAGLEVRTIEGGNVLDKTVYQDDPRNLSFHIYTESWKANSSNIYWESVLAKMYAPFMGFMPGGALSDSWHYSCPELDTYAKRLTNGQYVNSQTHWNAAKEATKLGLQEAVRIFICNSNDVFIAKKDRFYSRMSYGLVDGLNYWSLRSADVKPNSQGQKLIRAVFTNEKNGEFLSVWNPFNIQSFSDDYSKSVVTTITDNTSFISPETGRIIPITADFDKTSAQISPSINANGTMGGNVEVSSQAKVYNIESQLWEDVKANKKSAIALTSTIPHNAYWHSGSKITIADVAYIIANKEEFANNQDNKNNNFSFSYASQISESIKTDVAWIFANPGKISAYKNFNYSLDQDVNLANAVFPLDSGNKSTVVVLPWEIYEAVKLLVKEGTTSKSNYSYYPASGKTEIDLSSLGCVADIKIKLQQMLANRYVPSSIREYITTEEAIARYEAAIDFLSRNGHAYISNGPFYISEINSNNNTVTLEAFRNYKYRSDYWTKVFRQQLTKITNVVIPIAQTRTTDAVIEITASSFVFPDAETTPLGENADITLHLISATGNDMSYKATFIRNGVYNVVIPEKDLSTLPFGTYFLTIESKFSTELPSVYTSTITLM